MTAPSASVAAVQKALGCWFEDTVAGVFCNKHHCYADQRHESIDMCEVAVAAADAAVEAALEEVVIHVRGFGDVGGVDASMIVGNLADVANGTIDAAQAHGHDVKRSTVRDLNGWLREAHATVTVDPDHPMWHRFLRPSDEWPRADRIEARP